MFYRKPLALLMLVLVGSFVAGFVNQTKEPVSIGEISCNRDDIEVNGYASAGRSPPMPDNAHLLGVRVIVKCKGTGVKGAKISVNYRYPMLPMNYTKYTDSTGEAIFRPIEIGGVKPSKKVTVTLTPDKGDKFLQDVKVEDTKIFKLQMKELSMMSDTEKAQALRDAANWCDTDTLRTLLEHGVDVNAKNIIGNTALMRAARKGYTEIMQILLAKGADVDIKSKYGNTALMIVADKGDTDTVRFLLEHGADVDAKDNYDRTALMMVADKGDIDTVRFLVEHGVDVDTKSKFGETTLYQAIASGNIDIVQALIAKGADVNVKNNNGDTVLMWAKKWNHKEIIRILKEAGAKE